MITKTQASILISLLDIATGQNWPDIVEDIKNRGMEPRDIVDAWKSLEQLAGMSGSTPTIEDFEY